MHRIACPNCQRKLRLNADQLKRKLRCSACPTRFVVGGKIGVNPDGSTEHLAVELFDEEVVEDFEVVEDTPAPAPAKAVSSPKPKAPSSPDSIIPDEFGLVDDEPAPATSKPVPPPRPATPAKPIVVRTPPASPAHAEGRRIRVGRRRYREIRYSFGIAHSRGARAGAGSESSSSGAGRQSSAAGSKSASQAAAEARRAAAI